MAVLSNPATANGTQPLGAASDGKLAAGVYQLHAQGTFGSGTLAVQFSLDGGTTWTTMHGFLTPSTAASLTASGDITFAADAEALYQVALTGSTNPSFRWQVGQILARK